MMTYRIGCEAADLFAGIAPVIGNIPTPIFPSCTPSRAVGLLAINGDADPFVPFTGGEVCSGISKRFCEGGNVASQQKSVSVFASKAGCDLTPMREDLVPKVSDGTTVEKETYSSCAKNISVGAYIVHGGGHAWPPRASQLSLLGSSRAGISSKNLDATAEIVKFFLAIPKEGTGYESK
jgi:polyhydroxybutyrate depolymerase